LGYKIEICAVNLTIEGVSYYLPATVLSNRQLEKEFPSLRAEQILKTTGIEERHISAPDEIGSDVCYKAALILFEDYHISPADFDFLLVCTEGLDYKAPCTAMILHDRLDLSPDCGALDIPMGCTGFVNGLLMAESLIVAGHAKRVLLLTGDVPSKVIHAADQELRVLFGDAGAATSIIRSEKGRIGPFLYGVDGANAKNLWVERSGARTPPDLPWLLDHQALPWGRMRMDGAAIFSFSLKRVPKLVHELLSKGNLDLDDVDHFIFHQANGFLLEVLRKRIGIPRSKFHICLKNVGNTVSASIPIALRSAMNNKRIEKGDRAMLVSFGIGLSWAAVIIEL